MRSLPHSSLIITYNARPMIDRQTGTGASGLHAVAKFNLPSNNAHHPPGGRSVPVNDCPAIFFAQRSAHRKALCTLVSLIPHDIKTRTHNSEVKAKAQRRGNRWWVGWFGEAGTNLLTTACLVCLGCCLAAGCCWRNGMFWDGDLANK